jgi:hypothetical protein
VIFQNWFKKHPNLNAAFSINTFGFGYNLDSQLLSDLAHAGKGMYGRKIKKASK